MQHRDRVRRAVRPRHDPLAHERPHSAPGAGTADVVEEIARRSGRAAPATVGGGRRRGRLGGGWTASRAFGSRMTDRSAVCQQEHRSRDRRSAFRPSRLTAATIVARDRHELGPLGFWQSDEQVAGSQPRRPPRQPPGASQPASSVATSWTARTCLHGPRSPRWRPYHGHVQVQPSAVDRTRYSTPPAPATHPAIPTRPRTRSEPQLRRRAAGRRGGVAGGARCARGRTAARGGRSRPRRGRSRRCPTAPAPPGRPRPRHATGPSSPRAPRHPAAAPSRARRGPRRCPAAGVASASRWRARPSPEKPRQTSGLSTSVRRAPGHVELPAGAAVAGHGKDPQRRRVADDPIEEPQPGKAGEADGAADPDRGGAVAVRGRPGRARPAASMGTSGSTGRRLASRRHRARLTGASSAWIAWTSRNPRSQRDGNGTRRSTADSPSASTSTAVAPTDRPSWLRSCTPASADRIPGPKSTFVVPRPSVSPSYAVGQQVDPAVDAATGRERLEPQPVVGAGRHRVGEYQDAGEHRRRHVEPGARDVAERQQQVGGDDRQEQRAPKELRVGRRSARRRKPKPPSLTVADDVRRERIAVSLLQDRRRESHRSLCITRHASKRGADGLRREVPPAARHHPSSARTTRRPRGRRCRSSSTARRLAARHGRP